MRRFYGVILFQDGLGRKVSPSLSAYTHIHIKTRTFQLFYGLSILRAANRREAKVFFMSRLFYFHFSLISLSLSLSVSFIICVYYSH